LFEGTGTLDMGEDTRGALAMWKKDDCGDGAQRK